MCVCEREENVREREREREKREGEKESERAELWWKYSLKCKCTCINNQKVWQTGSTCSKTQDSMNDGILPYIGDFLVVEIFM